MLKNFYTEQLEYFWVAVGSEHRQPSDRCHRFGEKNTNTNVRINSPVYLGPNLLYNITPESEIRSSYAVQHTDDFWDTKKMVCILKKLSKR